MCLPLTGELPVSRSRTPRPGPGGTIQLNLKSSLTRRCQWLQRIATGIIMMMVGVGRDSQPTVNPASYVVSTGTLTEQTATGRAWLFKFNGGMRSSRSFDHDDYYVSYQRKLANMVELAGRTTRTTEIHTTGTWRRNQRNQRRA